MHDPLQTRASLLVRLRDRADHAAWKQFVELYGSLVYGFARQCGVQDADAADLTQEVFVAVAQAAGRWHYDRSRGSFRGWLYRVTRNKFTKFVQRRRLQPVGSGDDSIHAWLAEQASPTSELEAAWEDEFQQQLFRVAAAKIQDSFASTTWQAFWRTTVDGQSATAAARELRMSVGAVYVARSRVLARLAREIQDVQRD